MTDDAEVTDDDLNFNFNKNIINYENEFWFSSKHFN